MMKAGDRVLHQTEHPYLLGKGCRKRPCWDFRHKHGVWQCSRSGNFWKYSGKTAVSSSFLRGRTSIPSWALSFSLLWVWGVSHWRGGSEVPRQERRPRGHCRVCIWRRRCQPGLWLRLWNGIIPMLMSIRPCHKALFVIDAEWIGCRSKRNDILCPALSVAVRALTGYDPVTYCLERVTSEGHM